MLSRAWLRIHARLVPLTPRRPLLLVAVVAGGAGGGGKGKGKGNKSAVKRNVDGSPKTDGQGSPLPKGRSPQSFAPGSFASNCTWSAQVLTIKRDVKDKKTGILRPMPPGILDVGKFCAANGVVPLDSA